MKVPRLKSESTITSLHIRAARTRKRVRRYRTNAPMPGVHIDPDTGYGKLHLSILKLQEANVGTRGDSNTTSSAMKASLP